MATRIERVKAEVQELIDLLAELGPEEWERPTACDGFRVRDVVAHLVLAREPFRARTLTALAKGPRFFVDFAGRASVEGGTALSSTELLDRLGRVAQSPRSGFLGKIDPADNMLVDHATHLQDIRIGLGRRASHDPEQASVVLSTAVRLWRPITWGTRERARGLRLVADDVGWAHGRGPELVGAYDALLLALGGRPIGLDLLDGPGRSVMADRMPHP